ncbi:MAG: 2Fe-2S iron-sulfur cluster-binding protein, partial [Vicinamibacterales bacterium]|nr:2Fe-2S iron-sulfur cluster-binding protein [Vicinamibacterales bacterium]
MTTTTTTITFSVNGRDVEILVAIRTTVAEVLRDVLRLTGTKVSCEIQVCGACTVLVDGHPVSACSMLACDLDGTSVTTIEGLSQGLDLHPIQEAFVETNAFQCGYCTPGFILMTL